MDERFLLRIVVAGSGAEFTGWPGRTGLDNEDQLAKGEGVMKRKTAWAVFAFLVLAVVGTPAWGGQAILLNDAELDQVYGGEPSEDDESLVVWRSCGTCALVIDSGSQANATSVITVNAVSSRVAAQVNMTINHGGTIGSAVQMNFSSGTP